MYFLSTKIILIFVYKIDVKIFEQGDEVNTNYKIEFLSTKIEGTTLY